MCRFTCLLTDSAALSPLLFVIVTEAISREFRVALLWELLYADDLVVIAETEGDLIKRLDEWKGNVEMEVIMPQVGTFSVTAWVCIVTPYWQCVCVCVCVWHCMCCIWVCSVFVYQGENIKLDPELHAACKDDVAKHCAKVKAGNAAVSISCGPKIFWCYAWVETSIVHYFNVLHGPWNWSSFMENVHCCEIHYFC